MSKPKSGGARRLRMLQRGLRTRVVDRILDQCLEEVEADVNKNVPMCASDAELTNYLLAYEELNPQKFGGTPHNGGRDLKKMSNLQLHELGNKIEAAKAVAKAKAAAEAAIKAALKKGDQDE